MAGTRYISLKSRRQFLAVTASGTSIATKSLVLQALPTPPTHQADDCLHVGITVSGRVGGAVLRNRVKRRFRAVIREIMLPYASPDYWYVLIGRRAAFDRPYDALQKDLRYALHQLGVFVAPNKPRRHI